MEELNREGYGGRGGAKSVLLSLGAPLSQFLNVFTHSDALNHII